MVWDPVEALLKSLYQYRLQPFEAFEVRRLAVAHSFGAVKSVELDLGHPRPP